MYEIFKFIKISHITKYQWHSDITFFRKSIKNINIRVFILACLQLATEVTYESIRV